MNQHARDPSRLRPWVLKLHLYGGLICSSYLILYGISSLNFNHPLPATQGDRATITWSRPLALPDNADDRQLAEQARDALGLFGWPLSWAMHRDDQNELHFELARPGKRYLIHIARQKQVVHVEERRQSIWAIMRVLHGLAEEVPGSRVLLFWWAFTELTTWIVVFSALSGLYLWTFRRKERRIGSGLILGATGLTIALIVYLILRG